MHAPEQRQRLRALPLEVLQQEICAFDDFMNGRDFGIWLLRNECRFQAGVYLRSNGSIILLGRRRNLFSEIRWHPQIELRVILRHAEQMTQKFTASYAPPIYHLRVKHVWLVASNGNSGELALSAASDGKRKKN